MVASTSAVSTSMWRGEGFAAPSGHRAFANLDEPFRRACDDPGQAGLFGKNAASLR